MRAFLCREEGQGASQTSLVTSLPAQARELLAQAVAYNSSYSSRLEERDGLAIQVAVPVRLQDGQLRHPAQAGRLNGPHRTARTGGRTAENEVGADGDTGEQAEHGATRATDALGTGGSDQTHGQHGQHEVMIGPQTNQCSEMLQVNL